MFTGLIQEVGRVVQWLSPHRLQINCEACLLDVSQGDSIAVNGVCLTVVFFDKLHQICEFDVSAETQSRWNQSAIEAGRLVNLERSLRVGDKIGGHFVLGHVDGIAKVTRLELLGEFWLLQLEMPESQLPYVIPKGSLAVDGISLTINHFSGRYLEFMIVPHTMQNTNLSERRVDDHVNIESDVLGKYVARQLQFRDDRSDSVHGISLEMLSKAGFEEKI